jgi:hypothetical protein
VAESQNGGLTHGGFPACKIGFGLPPFSPDIADRPMAVRGRQSAGSNCQFDCELVRISAAFWNDTKARLANPSSGFFGSRAIAFGTFAHKEKKPGLTVNLSAFMRVSRRCLYGLIRPSAFFAKHYQLRQKSAGFADCLGSVSSTEKLVKLAPVSSAERGLYVDFSALALSAFNPALAVEPGQRLPFSARQRKFA